MTTTRKTHDADLCERIRELEKRVEELERRPAPYWVAPWPNTWPTITYPWHPNNVPTITYGNTSVGATVDLTSVASGAQSSYTVGRLND